MLDPLQAMAPLFDAFEAAGHRVYFVGGCVRDIVMRAPAIGDIDLATDAPPEKTKEILAAHRFKAFPIGERFGTITTRVGSAPVEITTFRVAELYSQGSRHPEVQFGTDLRADLSRRDLSINAMAMDRAGNIIDPFDGQRGIRDRLLEVPGGGLENTVSILRDDPLRLLRIARFAARFGYVPTAETTTAARLEAAELANISHERWKAELDKLLVAPFVANGIAWLHEVGALQVLFEESRDRDEDSARQLSAWVTAAQPDPHVRWTLLLAWALNHADWMASADAWPPVATREHYATAMADRFRFSNRERDIVRDALAGVLRPHEVEGRWDAPRARRFHLDSPASWRVRFAASRALAADHPAVVADLDSREAEVGTMLERGDPAPRLPPGLGSRLIESFSLEGAAVGHAIELIRNAIIDDLLPNGAPAEVYVEFLRANRALIPERRSRTPRNSA